MMKNDLIILLILSLVFTAMGTALSEEEKVHKLDTTVVTASKKSKALDTPTSISIITSDELEEMGAKNVVEALKKIPGIIDRSSNNEAVAIRGMQSSMAGNSVILIDGVPQRIGDTRYDQFGFVPVSQIERIEVVKSGGISYGPGAARGIVNIITKKGKKDSKFNSDMSFSYGSWNTNNEYIGFSGMINNMDYFVNITNYATDGYEEEEQKRTSGLVKMGYNFKDKTRLGFSASFLKNDHDTAYGLSKNKWHLENYRKDIHFPVSETNSKLVWHNEKDQKISTYSLDLSHQDKQLFIDADLTYTNFDETYKDTKDIYTSTSDTRGDVDNKDQNTYVLNLSGGYNFNSKVINYSPTFGFNFENINFENRKFYPYDIDHSKDTSKYDVDVNESKIGFFWDNDFIFAEKFGFNIGCRVDRIDVKFNDKQQEPDNISIDEAETMYSWFIAPSFHFSNKGNIYISAGKNFWFPTPKYYAWAAQYESPNNRPQDLKPEKAFTYEIGYKHLLHKAFNINLAGFFIDYQNKFAGYYEDNAYKGMKNIGEAETYGIELELDGRICQYFGFRLSSTVLNAEWTEGEMRVYEHPTNERVMKDLDGYNITGIPDYTYVLGFDFFPFKGFKVSFDINGNGSYYIDYLNRLEYDAKTTIDANISYSWKSLKFWILGKNIFDEEFERATNTTGELTGAYGEPDTNYYVQDGAYFEGGVSYSF